MADESRRIDIGFQGGQVLPARVKQSAYDEPAQGARRRALGALVRARDASTRRSRSTCRRSSTSASTPKSSGSASSPPWTSRCCDCCARAATAPALERGGEALRAAPASTGCCGTRSRRPARARPARRPVPARVRVVAAPWSRTRRSSRWSAAPRPDARADLPPLDAHDLRAAPIPPRTPPPRSPRPARSRSPLPGGAALRGRPRAMALVARPTSASTTRRDVAGRRGAGLGDARRWSGSREDRHRRPAQRGQVLALQRAHPRRRAGGQLPVHDARAERRGGRRARRAARPRGRDGRRDAGRARGDPVPRHRRARARRPPGRGARQPVPRQHPRDRRDPARGARRTTTPRSSTPRAASTRSPTSRRSRRSCCYADLEQAERRLERVAKQAQLGRQGAVAEERWLREVVEALRAGEPVRTRARRRRARPAPRRALAALTSKPVLYVANVAEGEPLEPPPALVEHAEARGARATAVSARLEAELAELDDERGGGDARGAGRGRVGPRPR